MHVPAALTFYDIHHWPHAGRIVIVDKQPHTDSPVVTWLQVTTGDGDAGDATVAVAYALGAAGDLRGTQPVTVVLHDRHGNMLATPNGLGVGVVALRRVTPR